MKILNLYAGIGGNRKLWDSTGEHEITAVEYDPKIAAIYKGFFPNDTVIVADAHQYLIENYKKYDFIWGSPPCPTHSQVNHFLNAQGVIRYPDMSLYQEIIFLQYFCKGLYVIENVKSYYEPLIKPQISGRHYFWSNFKIPKMITETTIVGFGSGKQSDIGRFGPVKSLKGKRTEGMRDKNLIENMGKPSERNSPNNLNRKVLNNCCHPEIGLAILESALGIEREKSVKNGQLF